MTLYREVGTRCVNDARNFTEVKLSLLLGVAALAMALVWVPHGHTPAPQYASTRLDCCTPLVSGGIAAGTDGQILTVTATNAVTLLNEDVSRRAGERYSLPGGSDFEMSSGTKATLAYDGVLGRWRLITTAR